MPIIQSLAWQREDLYQKESLKVYNFLLKLLFLNFIISYSCLEILSSVTWVPTIHDPQKIYFYFPNELSGTQNQNKINRTHIRFLDVDLEHLYTKWWWPDKTWNLLAVRDAFSHRFIRTFAVDCSIFLPLRQKNIFDKTDETNMRLDEEHNVTRNF